MMGVKPAIVSLLAHVKDVLKTEAGIIHMAGGLGKTTVEDDLPRQSPDTIIANVMWAESQFKKMLRWLDLRLQARWS
jgi:hypothetical protein